MPFGPRAIERLFYHGRLAPPITIPGSPPTTAYLASSATDDAGGGVLLHAWWGLNGFVREHADRLAGDGFTVLAPDLYAGDVAMTPEAAEARMERLDPDAEIARVERALDALLAQPTVRRD